MPNPIINMVYGDYSFSPVPIITITKQNQKTNDGQQIGTLFNVRLNGQIYAATGGLSVIIAAQSGLRSALAADGRLFQVMCNSGVLFQSYPRINDVSFNESPDNWVITCPYTIELEFDEEPQLGNFDYTGENSGIMPPFISTAQEVWGVEFLDDKSYYTLSTSAGIESNVYRLRLTHNVSAVGKRRYAASGVQKPAWEQARDYVVPKLGLNLNFVAASGAFNLDITNFIGFNHNRVNNIDVNGGSYEVNESWIICDTNTASVLGNAVEDFIVDIRKGIDSDLTTIAIQGSIEGLETRSYGTNSGDFVINETKYIAASGYWDNIKDTARILPRVLIFAGISDATRTINIVPVNKTVGHNLSQGIITYAYEYNDRPSNCVPNSLIERITITDNNPHDIFAEIVIPGRSAGPILQDMETTTAYRREVSVEVVVAPPTGCGASNLFVTNPRDSVYNNIIGPLYSGLTSTYSQVFTQPDTETWEPKEGRYTRQVAWTVQNCS